MKGGLPETSNWHNSASSGRTASVKAQSLAFTSGLPKILASGSLLEMAKLKIYSGRKGHHELRIGGPVSSPEFESWGGRVTSMLAG